MRNSTSRYIIFLAPISHQLTAWRAEAAPRTPPILCWGFFTGCHLWDPPLDAGVSLEVHTDLKMWNTFQILIGVQFAQFIASQFIRSSPIWLWTSHISAAAAAGVLSTIKILITYQMSTQMAKTLLGPFIAVHTTTVLLYNRFEG